MQGSLDLFKEKLPVPWQIQDSPFLARALVNDGRVGSKISGLTNQRLAARAFLRNVSLSLSNHQLAT